MNETEKDQATIRTALVAARRGGASISQLAIAHGLAEKHQLANATVEIRTHLRNLIPDPNNGWMSIGKIIGLGMTSGMLTHFLLRAVSLRSKGFA
jgi:hypothetical protein